MWSIITVHEAYILCKLRKKYRRICNMKDCDGSNEKDSTFECENHFCSKNPTRCIIQIQKSIKIQIQQFSFKNDKISKSEIEFPNFKFDNLDTDLNYRIVSYHGGASIVYRNKLYISGGTFMAETDVSDDPTISISNKFLQKLSSEKKWEKIAKHNFRRNHVMTISPWSKDEIVICGGYSNNGPEFRHIVQGTYYLVATLSEHNSLQPIYYSGRRCE
jgi:hypothetical protein